MTELCSLYLTRHFYILAERLLLPACATPTYLCAQNTLKEQAPSYLAYLAWGSEFLSVRLHLLTLLARQRCGALVLQGATVHPSFVILFYLQIFCELSLPNHPLLLARTFRKEIVKIYRPLRPVLLNRIAYIYFQKHLSPSN